MMEFQRMTAVVVQVEVELDVDSHSHSHSHTVTVTVAVTELELYRTEQSNAVRERISNNHKRFYNAMPMYVGT